jgi:hypothetical protein
MKLIDILKEIINEGVKATFNDIKDPKKATSIEVSPSHIPGEQLITIDGETKKNSYDVFYSLKSTDDLEIQNIKNTQDALKYQTSEVNLNDLKNLVSKTLKNRIPKVDYIGFLESTGELNMSLVEIIQEIYGVEDQNIIDIKKIRYQNIDDAVDWEQFRKEADSIKQAIIQFLYKTAETPPKDPEGYTIRKSGQISSKIIQRLHSKYNLGLHPNLPNLPLPPIYDVIVKCITQGKTLLIVDDNIHTGTDFIKIFRIIENIAEKITETYFQPTSEEEKMFKEIDEIELHPKFKTSPFLKEKHKELMKIKSDYLKRKYILIKDLDKNRDRIFGYVLYSLSDADLER